MRGLAELKARAAETWNRPPNAADIHQSVRRFERGLTEVPSVDVNLGKQILQDLAVKAFLEGHPAEYFKLMPEGPPKHAAELLRDLKALALGEGKVETSPAAKAVAEPAKAPPGLEPLVPEGALEGWRPPVRDSARADLPPLEKAAEVGAALKARAEAALEPEKANAEAKAQAARQKLSAAHQRVLAPEQQERTRFKEIEAKLTRGLSAAERVRVRSLIEQNRTDPQILAELGRPVGENEEDRFLRDVEAWLNGDKLSDEEKMRALGLKKQGHTAAEVAAILRM